MENLKELLKNKLMSAGVPTEKIHNVTKNIEEDKSENSENQTPKDFLNNAEDMKKVYLLVKNKKLSANKIREKIKEFLKDPKDLKKFLQSILDYKNFKKEENKEATGSGSSGAYSGPLFGGDDEFIKKSDSETPKLKEGLAVGAMGLDKVEAKEATTSGSVGSYSTPSMWAKSTKKKDWGPSRKTQIPGGGFVKVKKKCTRFPYCNQGDINALKITKNESVKEAIKNVSEKIGISQKTIINILEQEYSKTKKRPK